jgi:hypothetical protein
MLAVKRCMSRRYADEATCLESSWGMAIRGSARSRQGINIQIVLRTAESGAFMFLCEVAPGASRHPIRSVSAQVRSSLERETCGFPIPIKCEGDLEHRWELAN